ncbi:retrovirus-related pol polyprotein from transposon TNT 1-94 [Tanacetum coccineum]
MDSTILLGQKNTLAEYMILSGADNRPPMLDKDLYDSWKSRMELYMQNREHERMILESVEHGPLIWPTIEENGVIRTKKYAELVAKDLWERDQLLMQGTSLTKQERECKLLPLEWSKFVTDVKLVKDLHTTNFDQLHAYLQQHKLHANEVRLVVPVFSPGDDPITCLNKAMAFLAVVASSSSRGNNASGQERVVKCYNCQGEGHMARQCTQPKRPRNATWFKDKEMLAKAQEAGQNLDEEQLAFLADPGIPDGQAVQTIIPNNVPHSETYLNDMENQSVHAMQDFEQSSVVDFTDNEISSYQNPFYLKKAQQIKPTLYDGIVISDKHVAMPVIDDEETLILEEDFRKRFIPQKELSAEQAFWYHMSNPSTESSDASPVKMEAPKELPKKRTAPDARTKGECGFKHTKAVFNNEIIPFLISLKDIFNVFDKDLLNEIMEVQTVFDQMEVVVQQCSVDKQYVLLTVMNYMSLNGESVSMEMQRNESCDKCFNLDAELLKTQNAHNDLLKSYSQLEKHCISLALTIQINQEIFQKDESYDNQNALEIPKYFQNNDLKAQLQDKDTTIYQFDSIKKTRVHTKEQSDSLIDKMNLKSAENEDLKTQIQDKIDLDPLAPRLLQNREAHIDYLKYTQKQAEILRGIVEQAKAKQPLDNALTLPVAVTPINNVKKVRFSEPLTSSSNIKQVESSKTSDSNTPVLSSTGLKCSTSNCGSKPTSNKKNDRILQTQSRNMKNKVEAQPRKVNKKNCVVEPIHDVNVKHSLLNANFELICATCNKSMFDDIHDMCLLDFVKNVNSRSKSAKKHKKQNIWKPTGYVFTEVGFKWKPTGRTFTLVGNSCPLTRITYTKVAPIKESTPSSVETSKPELKVYSRRPKNVSNRGCPDCPLVSGLRMFKTYDREPLSARELSCALGKRKKSSHQAKAEDTNQEKLYLLHMDLCGPMRVASINGKRYIFVIVDDYSRFTWVRFLRSKDEALEAIIKCIKNIQVCLTATVRNVRTDNET